MLVLVRPEKCRGSLRYRALFECRDTQILSGNRNRLLKYIITISRNNPQNSLLRFFNRKMKTNTAIEIIISVQPTWNINKKKTRNRDQLTVTHNFCFRWEPNPQTANSVNHLDWPGLRIVLQSNHRIPSVPPVMWCGAPQHGGID